MTIKKTLIKLGTTALTVVYFATNVAWAHKPTSSVWEQRREMKTQMVNLPMPSGKITDLQIPSAKPFIKTDFDFIETDPALSLAGAKLPIKFLLPYGSIRKILTPSKKTTGTPIVIHIQDVHMHAEAQSNIGNAVAAILKDNPDTVVALEGAFSKINLESFGRFPEKKPLNRVSDFLLQDNKISGPMHAALTFPSPEKLNVIGIDDESAYKANVVAYQKAAPLIEPLKKEWTIHNNELAKKKLTTLNPALLNFDTQAVAAREGSMAIGDFLQVLSKNISETTFSKSKETVNFLKALQLEKSLDFNRVSLERTQLLTALMSSLTEKSRNDLINASLAFQANALSATHFYTTLHDLCRKNGVNLTHFPAMQKYLTYVLTSGQINAKKLIQESRHLESLAYDSLIKTKDEQEMINASRQLYLVGKLLDFALTREEWGEYREGQLPGRRVAWLPSKQEERESTGDNSVAPAIFWPGPRFSTGFEPGSRPNDMPRRRHKTFNSLPTRQLGNQATRQSFEDFYHQAEIRDEKMAKQTINSLPTRQPGSQATRQPITILITGGFHASGIEKHLTDAGATVVSFVPRITTLNPAAANGSSPTRQPGSQATRQPPSYLSIFTQEKAPLNKLFEGEKLFLSPMQTDNLSLALLASASVTGDPNKALQTAAPNAPLKMVRALFESGARFFTWRNNKTGAESTLQLKQKGAIVVGITTSEISKNTWRSFFNPTRWASSAGVLEKWDVYRKASILEHPIDAIASKLNTTQQKVLAQLTLNRKLILGSTALGFSLLFIILIKILSQNAASLSLFLPRGPTNHLTAIFFLSFFIAALLAQYIINPTSHNLLNALNKGIGRTQSNKQRYLSGVSLIAEIESALQTEYVIFINEFLKPVHKLDENSASFIKILPPVLRELEGVDFIIEKNNSAENTIVLNSKNITTPEQAVLMFWQAIHSEEIKEYASQETSALKDLDNFSADKAEAFNAMIRPLNPDANPESALAGKKVLDLGTGEGDGAHAMMDAGAKNVFALEINASTIQSAYENRTKLGFSSEIVILKEDIVNPGLKRESGSFDFAFARSAITMIYPALRPTLLNNLKRLLKPGGRLVFLEPLDQGHPNALIWEEEQWKLALEKAGYENIFLKRISLQRGKTVTFIRVIAEKPTANAPEVSSIPSPSSLYFLWKAAKLEPGQSPTLSLQLKGLAFALGVEGVALTLWSQFTPNFPGANGLIPFVGILAYTAVHIYYQMKIYANNRRSASNGAWLVAATIHLAIFYSYLVLPGLLEPFLPNMAALLAPFLLHFFWDGYQMKKEVRFGLLYSTAVMIIMFIISALAMSSLMQATSLRYPLFRLAAGFPVDVLSGILGMLLVSMWRNWPRGKRLLVEPTRISGRIAFSVYSVLVFSFFLYGYLLTGPLSLSFLQQPVLIALTKALIIQAVITPIMSIPVSTVVWKMLVERESFDMAVHHSKFINVQLIELAFLVWVPIHTLAAFWNQTNPILTYGVLGLASILWNVYLSQILERQNNDIEPASLLEKAGLGFVKTGLVAYFSVPYFKEVVRFYLFLLLTSSMAFIVSLVFQSPYAIFSTLLGGLTAWILVLTGDKYGLFYLRRKIHLSILFSRIRRDGEDPHKLFALLKPDLYRLRNLLTMAHVHSKNIAIGDPSTPAFAKLKKEIHRIDLLTRDLKSAIKLSQDTFGRNRVIHYANSRLVNPLSLWDFFENNMLQEVVELLDGRPHTALEILIDTVRTTPEMLEGDEIDLSFDQQIADLLKASLRDSKPIRPAILGSKKVLDKLSTFGVMGRSTRTLIETLLQPAIEEALFSGSFIGTPFLLPARVVFFVLHAWENKGKLSTFQGALFALTVPALVAFLPFLFQNPSFELFMGLHVGFNTMALLVNTFIAQLQLNKQAEALARLSRAIKKDPAMEQQLTARFPNQTPLNLGLAQFGKRVSPDAQWRKILAAPRFPTIFANYFSAQENTRSPSRDLVFRFEDGSTLRDIDQFSATYPNAQSLTLLASPHQAQQAEKSLKNLAFDGHKHLAVHSETLFRNNTFDVSEMFSSLPIEVAQNNENILLVFFEDMIPSGLTQQNTALWDSLRMLILNGPFSMTETTLREGLILQRLKNALITERHA